jgi:hypothetical protein
MSEGSPAGTQGRPAFSKHRLEGLTDGIHAVTLRFERRLAAIPAAPRAI